MNNKFSAMSSNKTKNINTLNRRNYIVGSIDKTTGVLSFSTVPHGHDTLTNAQKEASRLAGLNTEKIYVVAQMVSGYSATSPSIYKY